MAQLLDVPWLSQGELSSPGCPLYPPEFQTELLPASWGTSHRDGHEMLELGGVVGD